MRLPSVLAALFLLLLAAPPACAQAGPEAAGMDESSAVEEFADRAAAAAARPDRGGPAVPVGQRPLVTTHEWQRTTGRIFGFTLGATYSYWIEGKFGKGSNASFHEQVFGPNVGLEAEFSFRIKDWVHGVLHTEYMYHRGSSGVYNGVQSTISSFSTESFYLGAKLRSPLRDIFAVEEDSFLDDVDLYLKIAGGPVYMTEVVRRKPAPALPYWESGTLWGLHLTAGVEWRLDERFAFFFEHTFDLQSPPHPAPALRPGNKANPFYYYVVQAGWVFYFD